MARNIPRALATFVAPDENTARMYSHVQAAVQPLLDFNTKWFGPSQGNTLNVLGNIAAKGINVANAAASAALTSFRAIPDGTLAAPGLAWLSNKATGWWHEWNGVAQSEGLTLVMQGAKHMRVDPTGITFRAPPGGGLPYFQDSNGNSLGGINGQGMVIMPSFVSGVGFQTKCYGGFLSNATVNAAGAAVTLTLTTPANGMYITHDQPGSVTGISWSTVSPNSGVRIYLLKNNVVVSNVTPFTSATSSQVITSAKFAKNALPFNANDFHTIGVCSTSSNSVTGVFITAWLTVELGA